MKEDTTVVDRTGSDNGSISDNGTGADGAGVFIDTNGLNDNEDDKDTVIVDNVIFYSNYSDGYANLWLVNQYWDGEPENTNKPYILLSRLGITDMVEDSTVACMYYSGDGTNQITFRGTIQTNAAAGFLAFNGGGVGDAAAEGRTAILFNGTANMKQENGDSLIAMMLESGARDTPGDLVVLNASAADTDEGSAILMEGVDFTLAGSDGDADITDLTMTGGDAEVYIGLLEHGNGQDKIIINSTSGASTNANDGFVAEAYTSDIAVYTQGGTSSGTASVLNGVTVSAS